MKCDAISGSEFELRVFFSWHMCEKLRVVSQSSNIYAQKKKNTKYLLAVRRN